MTTVDTITTEDGYTVRIKLDEDSCNPFVEFDGQPTLVLHEKAERRFGWTNDEDWGRRLNDALDRIASHGVLRKLYGPGGALECVGRWLRIYHGIQVVLPVGAVDHSGVSVYLGSGSAFGDPGGWDSGWVGWLFSTPEQQREWGWVTPRSDAEVEADLRACFAEFAAWVSGDVYGYVVEDPDGEELDSCWGFYGSDCWAERVGDNHGGYMREAFMDVIESDRHDRIEQETKAAAEAEADEAEIAELMLAEVGS